MHSITITDYKALSTSELNKLLNFKEFEKIAQNNTFGYFNLAEFIFYDSKVLFSQVIKIIQSSNKEKFNVLWGLLCRYSNECFEFYDCNYSKMSKDLLMNVLNSQLIDMEGDQLCYVRNEENVPFWDMLIYDDTYSWCISITHEDDKDGNRVCLQKSECSSAPF